MLTSGAEFDKRTSLGVKSEFPRVMKSATFFSESVAKSICAELSKDVVSVVPQVVDYSCPVCKTASCSNPVRDVADPMTRSRLVLATHPPRLSSSVLHPVHDQDAK